MDSMLYRAWFPQIVYNHHQTGPPGTVMFAPPFRDPFNYNFDPLIPIGIDLVGAAMHSRFVAEGKPGATMRSGSTYSTWWNGGLRTTVYFHNMIGLLTEAIGNPTPMEIPFSGSDNSTVRARGGAADDREEVGGFRVGRRVRGRPRQGERRDARRLVQLRTDSARRVEQLLKASWRQQPRGGGASLQGGDRRTGRVPLR